MNIRNFILTLMLGIGIIPLSYAQDQIQNCIQEFDLACITKDSSKMAALLHPNVEIGHSNGWIQRGDEVWKDLSNGVVRYEEVQNLDTDILEYAGAHTVAVRRRINVKGEYKTYPFEMKLSVLEIWIKEQRDWRLWKRQAVKIIDLD